MRSRIAKAMGETGMKSDQPICDLSILSVAGRRAGLVSRHSDGFLFHASDHLFNDIDGRVFATVGDARVAASCLASLERLSPRALKPWSR